MKIPEAGFVVVPPPRGDGPIQLFLSRWSPELEDALRTTGATHIGVMDFVGEGRTGLQFLARFADQILYLGLSGRIETTELMVVNQLRALTTLTLGVPADGINFASLSALRDCTIVRGGTLGTLSTVPGLRHLSLFECRVRDLSPIGAIRSLRSLQIYSVLTLTTLDGIEGLELEEIDLTYVSRLKSIRALTEITTLRKLRIIGGKAIDDIERLGQVISLRSLLISGPTLPSLEFVQGLKHLEKFATQNTKFAGKRCSVVPLTRIPNLKVLALIGIPVSLKNLTDIDRLGEMTSLEELRIHGGPDLSSIGFLRSLTNLRALSISRAKVLDGDLSVLFELPNLREIAVDPPKSPRAFKAFNKRYSPSLEEINQLVVSRGGKPRM